MKKILQIFSVFLLSCLAVVLFGVASHQEAKASGPWACITNGGNKAAWQNSGVIKACDDFFVYDPALSGSAKQPVFVSGKSAGSDDGNHKPVFQMTLAKDANGNLGYVLKDSAGQTTTGDYIEQNNLASVPFVATDTKKEFCSIIKSTSCDPYNGDKVVMQDGTLDSGHAGGFGIKTDFYSGPGIDGTAYLEAAKNQATKDAANDGECVDSPLSFFLCPINDAITSALDSTINLVAAILQTDAPGINNNTAVKNAEQAFVNIANSIYVVVFLLIILANFIAIPGQFFENYTIKKTLPKLIAAIILTQFMFFICIAIMDLSNIAGATIPVAIVSAYKGAPQTLGDAISQAFNPLTQSGLTEAGITAALDIGFFIFSQIILIVALVVGLIGLFYIIFRQFALYVLIIISPLALAAWVLPGTSKYTKQWFELYIKLCLMYLIVMLIIAFTAIGVDIFKNIATEAYKSSLKSVAGGALGPGPTAFFALLSALIIPVVGLILIAKSFKWSSKAVTEVGKVIGAEKAGKAASGAAKGAVKKSAQEGKLAEMKGSALSAFGARLPGEKGLKLQASGEAIKNRREAAKREMYDKLPPKKLLELSRQEQLNPNSEKNATKALTKKYKENAVTEKGRFDAGLPPLTGQEKIDFDAVAAAVGGQSYDQLEAEWAADKAARRGGGNVGPAGGGAPAPLPTPTPAAGAGGAPAGGGGGGGTPAPAAAPGGTGTSGTATPGTGAGPGQARSSAAQFNRGARAGRAATGSGPAPLSNPNATPSPNPAGGPPAGGTPPTPPAGPPPGFPGPPGP